MLWSATYRAELNSLMIFKQWVNLKYEIETSVLTIPIEKKKEWKSSRKKA